MERIKGKQLEKYINDYVIFDLETTGTNVLKDSIVEIAAIKVRNTEIIKEFSTLINPEKHIPQGATDINGITDDMVKDAPKFEEIADEFWDFINGEVLVGYNINNFDINLLYDAFLRAGKNELSNDFIDLLYVAKRNLTNLENHKLSTVCDCFGISTNDAHRALSDCYMTKKCYEQIFEKYGNEAFRIPYRNQFHRDYATREFRDDVQNLKSGKHNKIDTLLGKHFVLTGEFNFGARKDVKKYIEALGAIPDENIKQSTDYLIIGAQGSQSWKTGTYGEKMKKAMELQEKGHKIDIVSEKDFFGEINNFNVHNEFIEKNDSSKYDWESETSKMLEDLIKEYELPNNSLYLSINKGRNDDTKITSYTIYIFEPEFPAVSNEKIGKNKIVLSMFPTTVKSRINDLDLRIREEQEGDLRSMLPNDAEVLPRNKTDAKDGMVRVRIKTDSPNLVNYLRQNTEYCIKRYESDAALFGCCNKFEECSDVKKCIHENRLYSTSCMYRGNLERGKIFYGKNKNV